MNSATRLWPALLCTLLMVSVAACNVVPVGDAVGTIPSPVGPTPTATCNTWESSVVCEDRATATALSITPLPPPTLSAEFLTTEAEYRAELAQQTPVAPPPQATPTPSFSILAGLEEGTLLFRGRSSYQEQPRFEVAYSENAWRMAATADGPVLVHSRIMGCKLSLMAMGMGMTEAPQISQQELAGYTAEVRSFPKSCLISYGISAVGGYYLFGIMLPENTGRTTLAECQAAVEAVLNTFQLKQD